MNNMYLSFKLFIIIIIEFLSAMRSFAYGVH
jgi:hypothetical protein